jgi:hypothetical protein
VCTAGPTGLCSAKEADPGQEMRGKKKSGEKKNPRAKKKKKKSAEIRKHLCNSCKNTTWEE